MKRIFAVPVVRAAAASLVLSSAAFSVPTIAEESSLAIEEIIVTARKKEESVQDVPVAITALAAELQNSTVRRLEDVNGYAPNVIIRPSGRARASQITIRGVSATSSGDKAFDSPIAVSLDGVHYGTVSGRNVENFDLERIEVLRGPQGTLFGKNTVGGVINVIRSKPTGELGGKAKVTAGRYGQQEVRALLNFPLGETLAAKIYYVSVEGDGFLKRSFDGGNAPHKDYDNFGISLLWTPTDNFEAQLTIEQFNDSSDVGAPTNGNVLAGFYDAPTGDDIGRVADLSGGTFPCFAFGACRLDPEKIADTSETEQPNRGRYKNNAFTLNMNLALNDNLNIVSVTGYHDTPYEDTISDLDGTALDFIFINNDNVYEQFSQELRLEGSYERFDFVVGGYYFWNRFEQDWVTDGNFWQFLFPGLDDPGLADLCIGGLFFPIFCDPRSLGAGLGQNYDQRLFQTQDVESVAIFGQVDYEVTDKLIVTAGLRYTDETKDFIGYQAYLGDVALRYPFNFDIGNVDLSNSWDEITLKLGVAYHLNDDVMLFASYSEGFNSGGFFSTAQNLRDFERNQYLPETAKSYELGMKSQFFDNRLQLNVTGFYNDFQDKIDSNVVQDAETRTIATTFENIGSLIYKGVEVESRFVATQNLDLFASIGYLDAEYDEFMSRGFIPIQDLTNDSPAQDVSFLTPKLAPEWTFGAGGTYTVALGPGELTVHAKWNHFTEQETDTFNDPGTQIPAEDIVNAHIAYGWDNFRLTVFGQNLLDEQREVQGGSFPLFGVNGITSAGATYGVELEVVFGN